MLAALRATRRLQSHGMVRHLVQHSQWPPRLNVDLLSVREVRLISETGEDCGVMASREALSEARDAGRDLLEVNRWSDPPVVRVVDYQELQTNRAKKMYDARKQKKESRKMQRREGSLKQLRLSPATDTHDMQIKMRQATEFLCDGYRVRVYMQFRRGQGRLQEDAKAALVAAAEQLQDFGKVQGIPPGGEIADLFREEKDEDEDEEPMGPVKKKPLEVLLQPLSRKKREELNEAETEAEK